MDALSELLKKHGFKAQVIGEPPLFDIIFTDQPVKDYRDTLKADHRDPEALSTRPCAPAAS